MSVAKITFSALTLSTAATVAIARDQVQIAGSSTVLPYASIVAEAFGENFDYPTPVVESGGSSAGLKRFCEGVGKNTIDIANASRQIKPSELEVCQANGVTDIIEMRIGYDGIVFASEKGGNEFAYTASAWFLALSDQILIEGKLVDNPNQSWSSVNADLQDQPLKAFIPGTKHGTREVFEDKVILAGCEATGALDALKDANGGDEKAAEKACITLRTDGVSVDIDGDYTETLARIESNKNGIGIFGLAFYENNTDKLQVATMEGVIPTVESISSGEYPVSRPLYMYLKQAHLEVIPGLKDFAEFFVLDEIAGEDGPLAEYGLVADPELETTQEIVANGQTIADAN